MNILELTDDQLKVIQEMFNNFLLDVADEYESDLLDEVFYILNTDGKITE